MVDRFPIPIVHDAISIRNLPAQIRFAKAANEIRDLMGRAVSPKAWKRLLSLNQEQLQYRLVHSVEQGKILLTQQESYEIPLDYVENELHVAIDRTALAGATDRLVGKIRSLAQEAMTAAGCKPDVVFLTGGMAFSPVVNSAVAELVGDAIPIRSGDMLGSVGRGLGLSAQRTFA